MDQKYFTFAERELTLRFFGEDGLQVPFPVCEENDRRIDELPAKLKAAGDYAAKYELLAGTLGEADAAAVMGRADRQDSFAVEQLLLFIHRAYLEYRSKNLTAAAAGRAG